MEQFLAFVRKEFYHILRDVRTLLILFGLPVMQIVIFGFALNNEIKNAAIAILDNANDIHTQNITKKILSSGYFRFEGRLRSYADIEREFSYGKIKMALVFPQDFGGALSHGRDAQIQLVADATDQNSALTLTNYAGLIIKNYEREQSRGAALPGTINIENRMVFNPQLKGAYVFVPGLMALVLMLVSAMMTSVTIAREKESGTMEMLMVSPLTQVQIIVGKVVPYMVISFINAVIILILGVYALGMPMNGSITLILGEAFLFILMALALGILISTTSATQMEAMLKSQIGLMMPTIFLSGFIFPIESMPAPLQIVSRIMPARYFINIVKAVMIKGAGLAYVWQDTLILAGITLFFMALSLKKLKVRLQ